MKKAEMEKKIIELEAVVQKQNESMINTKIREHRDGYIHIPFSWSGFGRMMLAFGSMLLVMLNYFALWYFWNYFNIGYLFTSTYKIDVSLVSTGQLFFLYPLFAWFFSHWVCVCCLKYWVDGDEFDFSGLVGGLISGLVGGLVVGFVVGLISGLVGGLVVGLISGLVGGLVVGLVGGLVVGLIDGSDGYLLEV